MTIWRRAGGAPTVHDRRYHVRQRPPEGAAAQRARAGDGFFNEHRSQVIRTTIITAGEIAVMFERSSAAWEWLAKWKIYPLHPGVAQAAADVDRVLTAAGRRLGENDNWIAGFAAYHREPIISHDKRFDGIKGIRRIVYTRS